MFDLSTIGVFLYLIYPIIIIAISLYVTFTREMTSANYFFADRNTHWFILGISLLTSSMFSPYIFGFTLDYAGSSLPYIYGVISVVMLSILGWSLSPKFLGAGISTLPEVFENRFNKACRFFVSGLYILSNICIRLIIILIAGNIFFHMIAGIDSYFTLLFFLVITGLYLIVGGLNAELYVNVIQVLFIVLGVAGIAIWLSFQNNEIFTEANRTEFSAFTNINTGLKFTWLEIFIGLPIIGFWFWCADQFVVQKLVSARNINYARKASLVSAFFQFIPVSIFILPGIIATVFLPNSTPTNVAAILFQEGLIPDSLKAGLLIAVVSALMASLSSVLNSTSTLFTYDFYRSFKPETSDRKLVLIGRLTIMSLLFISFLLIPLSQTLDFTICIKLFGIFASIAALISAVLAAGLLNKKIKAQSAFITLCIGSVLIVFKSICEFIFDKNSAYNFIYGWFVNFGLMQFSIFVFLFSIISLFVFNRINHTHSPLTSTPGTLKIFSNRIKLRFKTHKNDFLVFTVFVVSAVGIITKIIV